MSSNKRVMTLVAIIVGISIIGYYLFNFVSGIFTTFTDADTQIASLKTSKMIEENRERKLLEMKRDLDVWQNMAISTGSEEPLNDYYTFFFSLVKKHNLTLDAIPSTNAGGFRGSASKSQSISFNQWTFSLSGKLPALVAFLKEFYSLNLPHSVKSMTMTPKGSGAESDVTTILEVEVMMMPPTGKPRPTALANPDTKLLAVDTLAVLTHHPLQLSVLFSTILPKSGLYGKTQLASKDGLNPSRNYDMMAKKNMFAGLMAPPSVTKEDKPSANMDTLQHVQICSITNTAIKDEALARNRLTNQYTTLRSDGGLNDFEIKDRAGMVVLKGKVLSVQKQDVVIAVENKAYAWHIGGFLADALKKELSEAELKKMEVAWAPSASKVESAPVAEKLD